MISHFVFCHPNELNSVFQTKSRLTFHIEFFSSTMICYEKHEDPSELCFQRWCKMITVYISQIVCASVEQRSRLKETKESKEKSEN